MIDIKELTKDKTRIRLVYNKETKEILGEFNKWRKENPKVSLHSNSNIGTVDLGYKRSGHYKYNFDNIEYLNLNDIHNNMVELHKKIEKDKYNKAKPIAKARLDAMEEELEALRIKHSCDIDYCMEGDTHGIYDDYMYISTEVNNIVFERRINQ